MTPQRNHRTKFRRGGTAAVLAVALPLLPLFVVGAASEQPAPDQPASLPALQVVVLVDESGSLSETDVVREKEAARTIVFSVLAPGSVVSVAGFGSSEREGQSAVDVVCPKTTLDSPQKRDSLATCIDGLHRRSDAEGDDTDHVAALQQALDVVRSEGPEKKIVFLLTDGRLDVQQSPSWGDTPERRQAAAMAKAKDVLGELDRAGAQTWPLGFGDVDNAALRDFARGRSCTPAAANPHEQIAATSAELTQAVAEAFSSASCVKYGPVDIDTVPTGGSADLTVDIPVIASDASIVVYKRDRRVQVEYRPPNSDKPIPVAGDPNFEFSGQSTETESLRITDPEPGRWTIHLSSADVPAQDVAANVVYQAAVKANIVVSPQPVAGQTLNVEMQVRARGQAITEQQALRDLSFAATLTGSSGFPAQQISLSDPENDGTFSGQVKVPDDASGNLTITGQVTGLGIGGDTRQWFGTVQSGPAAIQAQLLFDSNQAAVTPGGTVSGTVQVNNASGQPANLRLALVDPTSDKLTVDPLTVRVDPGPTTTPFTLRFGADTPVGSHAATLRLVDEANPDVAIAERLFATEVTPEPGLLEKLLWLWITLAAVLLAALSFALLKLRSRLNARKVRGLHAQLLRSGFVTSELDPRDPNSTVFGFVLHEDFTGPQLQHAGPNEPNVYQARRVNGGVSLTIPGQQPVILAPGERRELGQNFAVIILDERAGGGPADSRADYSGGNAFAESVVSLPAPTAPFNDTSADDSYHDPNNPFR